MARPTEEEMREAAALVTPPCTFEVLDGKLGLGGSRGDRHSGINRRVRRGLIGKALLGGKNLYFAPCLFAALKGCDLSDRAERLMAADKLLEDGDDDPLKQKILREATRMDCRLPD